MMGVAGQTEGGRWLIRPSAFDTLRAAMSSGGELQGDEHRQFALAGNPATPSVRGSTAEIGVVGVLTKCPDVRAWRYFGANTVYRDIEAALAQVAADPQVQDVVLNIDSPGGQVDGLFECLAAIEAFSKPIRVRATCACSAAYAIACATGGKIEATNLAAEFGSVGVAQTHYLHPDVQVVGITSTNAPDKRPDVSTEEGRAVVRRELDALHDLFVDVLARGRGKTAQVVNQTFGRGAVLLAGEAKLGGMIDSVASRPGGVGVASATRGASSSSDIGDRTVALLKSERSLNRPGWGAPTAAPVRQQPASNPASGDIGDRTVALLAARRGLMPTRRGAEPTAAPVRQQPASSPASGDIGDRTVALLNERSGQHFKLVESRRQP